MRSRDMEDLDDLGQRQYVLAELVDDGSRVSSDPYLHERVGRPSHGLGIQFEVLSPNDPALVERSGPRVASGRRKPDPFRKIAIRDLGILLKAGDQMIID